MTSFLSTRSQFKSLSAAAVFLIFVFSPGNADAAQRIGSSKAKQLSYEPLEDASLLKSDVSIELTTDVSGLSDVTVLKGQAAKIEHRKGFIGFSGPASAESKHLRIHGNDLRIDTNTGAITGDKVLVQVAKFRRIKAALQLSGQSKAGFLKVIGGPGEDGGGLFDSFGPWVTYRCENNELIRDGQPLGVSSESFCAGTDIVMVSCSSGNEVMLIRTRSTACGG